MSHLDCRAAIQPEPAVHVGQTCGCGVAYVPEREQAKAVILDNPELTNRAAARLARVSFATADRARAELNNVTSREVTAFNTTQPIENKQMEDAQSDTPADTSTNESSSVTVRTMHLRGGGPPPRYSESPLNRDEALGSPVREQLPLGSVRGAASNDCPYRD